MSTRLLYAAILAAMPLTLAAPAAAQFDPLDNHLKCYKIRGAPIAVHLLLDNQFGKEEVTKLTPALLCTPTQEICCAPGVATCHQVPCPPDPGPNQPAPVDHFKCYTIQTKTCLTGDCSTLGHFPKGTVVTLTDQFHTEPTVVVGPPELFCTPVLKEVISPTTTTSTTTSSTTTSSTTSTTTTSSTTTSSSTSSSSTSSTTTSSMTSSTTSSSTTTTLCQASYYEWAPPTTSIESVGAPSAVAIDTGFNPQGYSYSYFAQNQTLFAVRNVTDGSGAAGSVKWTWNAPAVLNSPTAVALSTGAGEFIFVAASDGKLYKIRAADGTFARSADTRRGACANDKITATPAVQLYNFANAAFQNNVDGAIGHVHDDVVFVVTHYDTTCSGTGFDRVFAIWASDLTVKWAFNTNGEYGMIGNGNETGTIDAGTNTLFFGTFAPTGTALSSSLWALDTLTGNPQWADNAGSILNRPMLVNGRLYVANVAGEVLAYDLAGDGFGGGVRLWTVPVQLAAGVVRNFWAESRSGPFQGDLLVADASGNLHAIRDQGTSGAFLWSNVAGTFTSMPVVLPSETKAYIGRSDGQVQQIDLASGAGQGTAVVNAGATVFDPALDVEGPQSLDRLVAVAGGVGGGPGSVTRLLLPLCNLSNPPPP